MLVSEIKPYSKNAKKHPKKQVEQIASSIKEFGFNQPIVIDSNNTVIVGHGRLEAAKLLGLLDVPVLKVELSEERAKSYRLADNKLNESEWDMGLVIEELKGLSDSMIDLTSFSKDLILESDEKDDLIPAIPDRAKTVIGDIYRLGNHSVICGDATQVDIVNTLMEGEKADMIFTDPPYNVDYTGMQNSRQWDKIENDSMDEESFTNFLKTVFKNFHLYSKPEAAFYICHADKSHNQFRRAFESVGYMWRATIIWVKNSPAFNFAQYKYAHEPIFYCFKENQVVKWLGDNKNKTVWEQQWDDKKIINWFKNQIKTDKEQAKTTIWEAKKERGNHPIIKPIELILKAITNSSDRGDLVIDFFGGSGSTLIACEKSGRKCRMSELAPRYVDVIVQRYVDYTGNTIIIKNGQETTWQKTEVGQQ